MKLKAWMFEKPKPPKKDDGLIHRRDQKHVLIRIYKDMTDDDVILLFQNYTSEPIACIKRVYKKYPKMFGGFIRIFFNNIQIIDDLVVRMQFCKFRGFNIRVWGGGNEFKMKLKFDRIQREKQKKEWKEYEKRKKINEKKRNKKEASQKKTET
jgi:hypothetical protein